MNHKIGDSDDSNDSTGDVVFSDASFLQCSIPSLIGAIMLVLAIFTI
jgi:hypothetical protein